MSILASTAGDAAYWGLAIFLIPALFVLVEKLSGKDKPAKAPAPSPGASPGAPGPAHAAPPVAGH